MTRRPTCGSSWAARGRERALARILRDFAAFKARSARLDDLALKPL
jgi:hypothetical protein